jgi:Rps23 Pro-64 3,4-dihydroxylase Tpa1-like proline 4-hydroxylase
MNTYCCQKGCAGGNCSSAPKLYLLKNGEDSELLNFLALLNNISGMSLTKLSTLFMSKYRSGHFLSPHSDKGNGRLAFVISLSKDWMPQYGGLLHFLSQDRTQIVNTVCPVFNNMLIFKVDDIEKPHYVSHVASNVLFNRISISGWFE